MKKRAFFASLIFVLVLLGCEDKSAKPLEQNDKITLNTTNGEKIVIQKTKNGFLYAENRTLFLAFFTTSCIPCKAEIPHLNNLGEKYKENFDIVAVMLDNKTLGDFETFSYNSSASFPIAFGEGSARLSATFGNITDVPFMAVFDREGNYVKNYVGAIPEEMIDADIRRIF